MYTVKDGNAAIQAIELNEEMFMYTLPSNASPKTVSSHNDKSSLQVAMPRGRLAVRCEFDM